MAYLTGKGPKAGRKRAECWQERQAHGLPGRKRAKSCKNVPRGPTSGPRGTREDRHGDSQSLQNAGPAGKGSKVGRNARLMAYLTRKGSKAVRNTRLLAYLTGKGLKAGQDVRLMAYLTGKGSKVGRNARLLACLAGKVAKAGRNRPPRRLTEPSKRWTGRKRTKNCRER